MDIAKYIGQYILKNNFCYIHGLGNMELVKRPATHDGKLLHGATYEVIITSGGSIDDSFANFIATNEQISISKAANALRDFSIQARKDMQAGKEVLIPGIGKFTEEGGKVKFFTDTSFRFTPEGMPALKNSKQLEDQKMAPAHKPSYPAPVAKVSSVNWTTVAIAGILLILVAAGGYGFYYYKKQQKQNAIAALPPVMKDTVVQVAPPPVVVDTTHRDTLVTPPATVATPVVDTNAVIQYKIVLCDTTNKAYAMSRFRKLKIDGKHPEMFTKDSLRFQIMTPMSCRAVDTTHVKDSIRKFFGCRRVSIFYDMK